MKYRVYFQRSTSVECFLEVEADSEQQARSVADKLVESTDDALIEIPESYTYDCGPTGEVMEIQEGEVDAVCNST